MHNRGSLHEIAKLNDWSIEEFGLFNGNVMATYERAGQMVRAETNEWGGITWAAWCENGWQVETLKVGSDRNALGTVVGWLRTPVGQPRPVTPVPAVSRWERVPATHDPCGGQGCRECSYAGEETVLIRS